MPVDIEGVLQGGFERTVARNGLLFVGIFYVLSILGGLFSVDPTQQPLPTDQMGGPGMAPVPAGGMEPAALSLGLPPWVAVALSLLLGIVSLVVTIAALRTFVSDETEQIPGAFFTRNVVWAAVNLFVGNIVFSIALAIGFVLLIIPGFFLLVSLFFWQVYVAVEDQNFVEGFSNSWELTSGHRLQLFALGVVVVVIGLVVSIVFGIPGILLPDILGYLITQAGSAFIGVFFIAAVAQAYKQLVATETEQTADLG